MVSPGLRALRKETSRRMSATPSSSSSRPLESRVGAESDHAAARIESARGKPPAKRPVSRVDSCTTSAARPFGTSSVRESRDPLQ